MKDKQINLRLSEELYNMLVLKSKASNISMSDYIRSLIANSEVKYNDNKSIGNVIGAINKVGNNINQIAHNLNIAQNDNKLDDVDYKDIINHLLIIECELKDILESI